MTTRCTRANRFATIGLALAFAAVTTAHCDTPIRVVPLGATQPVEADSFMQGVEGRPGYRLAAALASVRASGAVEHGVAVLGGDLELDSGARIRGDVVVVGGEAKGAANAKIAGRVYVMPGEWIRDAVRAFYALPSRPEAPPGSRYYASTEATVAEDETVEGDVVIARGSLTVLGQIKGSVLALGSAVRIGPGANIEGSLIRVLAAGEAEPTGSVEDAATVWGGVLEPPLEQPKLAVALVEAERPEARTADATRAPAPMRDLGSVTVAGSSRVFRSGERLADLVVLGGSVTVEDGALVDGDVSVYGGTLTLRGHVRKSLSVLGGSAALRAPAIVEGDLQCVGGSISVGKDVEVRGRISNLGGHIGSDPEARIRGPELGHIESVHAVTDLTGRVMHNLGWTLFLLLGGFAVLLLVAAAWPRRVRAVADQIREHPGRCALTGTVAVAALALATIVLTVPCCIGILLAPVFAALVWVAHLLGAAGLGAVVGDWVLRRTPIRGGTVLASVAAGTGVIIAAKLLLVTLGVSPSLRTLLSLALAAIGVGAVFMTNWGWRSATATIVWPGWARRHAPPWANGDPTAGYNDPTWRVGGAGSESTEGDADPARPGAEPGSDDP